MDPTTAAAKLAVAVNNAPTMFGRDDRPSPNRPRGGATAVADAATVAITWPDGTTSTYIAQEGQT